MSKKDEKANEIAIIDENVLRNKIYIIRGQKVMLDADLAAIYGYSTKTFNQQVKNNIEKFPSDMMFQLTKEEIDLVRSKILTTPEYQPLSWSKNLTSIEPNNNEILRCQNGTSRLDNLDDVVRCQNGTSPNNVSWCQNGTSIMEDDTSRSKNLTLNDYENDLRSKKSTSRLHNLDNIEISSKDLSWSQNATTIDNKLSRCQNGTLKIENNGIKQGHNIKYLPYAFTEQGIYMLISVLKGELATKQSIALVRLFKSMKDYIYENADLMALNERTSLLEADTKLIKNDIFDVKTDLKKVMDNFIDPSTYKHFLIMNGKKIEADMAYISIYKKAKRSIYYIDNYIGVKTLQLLSYVGENMEIIIFSDNLAKKDGVNKDMLRDFMIQNPTNPITIRKTNGKFHDRYIVLDYGSDNDSIYFCGYSSKDAGKKISTIIEIEDNKQLYYPLIDCLLNIG